MGLRPAKLHEKLPPSGDGALRGLTGLPWISGAFCRKFAGSPVCPRFPGPGPRIGFSTLSCFAGPGCLTDDKRRSSVHLSFATSSPPPSDRRRSRPGTNCPRSEEHTSELQSLRHLVCRL